MPNIKKYLANDNDYTHIIKNINGEFKIKLDKNNKIWEFIEENDEIFEKIPNIHPLFFKFKINELDIINCIKFIQNFMLNKNKKANIECRWTYNKGLIILFPNIIDEHDNNIKIAIEISSTFPISKKIYENDWKIYQNKEYYIENWNIIQGLIDDNIDLNKITNLDTNINNYFLRNDKFTSKLTQTEKKKKAMAIRITEEKDINLNFSKKQEIELLLSIIPSNIIIKSKTLSEELGKLLFNEIKEDGLDIWINYIGNEENCNKLWDKWFNNDSTNSYFTIITLHTWAKRYNIEEYRNKYNLIINSYINKCIGTRGSDRDRANLVSLIFKTNFIYSSQTNEWYELIGGKLERDPKALSFRNQISEIIPNLFEEKFENLNEEYKNSFDEIIKEKIKLIMDKCEKMEISFKSCGLKTSLMNELSEIMYDKNFQDKENYDREYFCWDNGILHLGNEEMIEGNIEYFITRKSPIKFNMNYTWEHPAIKEVMKILKQIIVNDEVREFKLISDGMAMKNNYKKLARVDIGPTGNNGKTTWMQLLRGVAGEYASLMSISFLCSETAKIGTPLPEIEQIKHSRWVFASETKIDKPINEAMFKTMTGNDGFPYRNLFDRLIREIKLSFLFIVLTNNVLRLSSTTDKTTLKRLKYVDHPSIFNDEAPKEENEQFKQMIFPKDDDFSDRIPDLLKPFAWILYQYHIKYRKEGLKIPKTVDAMDADYKNKVNIFVQFITDKIIKDNDSEITLEDAYLEFTNWFIRGAKFGKRPSNDEMHEDFTERFKKYEIEKDKWRGLKLKRIVSDETEFIKKH